MDRAQAIEALRGKGFEARERRWSLGDTIFVGAGQSDDGGIRAFRVGTYIYPNEHGWAVIVDTRVPRLEPDAQFERLEEAVECAAAFLTRELAKLSDDL